jgi:hypothetical protein
LRVLGLPAGNGFWARKTPGDVMNGAEGRSSRPNGLEDRFEIEAEGIGQEL